MAPNPGERKSKAEKRVKSPGVHSGAGNLGLAIEHTICRLFFFDLGSHVSSSLFERYFIGSGITDEMAGEPAKCPVHWLFPALKIYVLNYTKSNNIV